MADATAQEIEQIPKQLWEDVRILALKYIDKAEKQKQHCYNYYINHKDTEEYRQRTRAAKKKYNDAHKEEIKAKRGERYKQDEEYRKKVRAAENRRYKQRNLYNVPRQRGRPPKSKEQVSDAKQHSQEQVSDTTTT